MMKTKDHLNSEILKITMVITSDFPELLTYLNEMPNTIPKEKHPEIDIAALQVYYNSLYNLMLKYASTHNCFIKNKLENEQNVL